MILESVKIQNFKRVGEIELPLSDLNILVGSNGSGKSSILQALHLASCLMRQADRIRAGSTAMVRVSDLDYLPSDEYWRLGHGADWGNKAASPSSIVGFNFRAPDDGLLTARIEMRSARNAGISVTGELPDSLRTMFRGEGTFFSGFIPGISGIPNYEQKNARRVVLKACSFGDSNVYLRNALDLLPPEGISQIESWLEPLLGEIKFYVSFNQDKDFHIKAEAELSGIKMPLELLGTGYLQLIQIFCYILVFNPKILLIDEPDIHLHPMVQEKLPAVLLSIAHSRGVKILISTHSPFIVRGAPPDSNVVWLSEGQKVTDDRSVVELALGWGAFGKKVIVVSEDSNNQFLKKLIQQWPELERAATVLPGRGYSSLMSKEEAVELKETLGGKFKILVHRDRDSLTDEEVQSLRDTYAADGIALWVTDQSDIEAEFCHPEFLSSLVGEPLAACSGWVEEIIAQHSQTISDQFKKHRAAHNSELHKAGGSPANQEVWAAFQTRALKGAKGKFIFGQLKNKVPGSRFSEAKVISHSAYPQRAVSLKAAIESLLV